MTILREDGELVRYAFESSKLGTTARIRKLFRTDRSNRLSIFRTDGLNSDEVLHQGLYVARLRKDTPSLNGWVEFHRESVEEFGLRIEHDENPPRHAHIASWPANRGDSHLIERELARKCYRQAIFDPPIDPNDSPKENGFASAFLQPIPE